MVFTDSDVYKWLEALGWELGARAVAGAARTADDDDRAAEAAQGDDGYLNSYYQVVKPGTRWHEPGLGPRALLRGAPDPGRRRAAAAAATSGCSASRAASPTCSCDVFGATRRARRGHPEIETRAGRAVPAHRRARVPRPRAALRRPRAATARCEPATHSARATSRTACRCASATRSRATPCARCTSPRASPTLPGDRRGGAAGRVRAQWRDMVGRKTYVTGGVGARHRDEAFGDAVRAAARPRLRRDVRGDRVGACGTGGCCWPPARRATPT